MPATPAQVHSVKKLTLTSPGKIGDCLMQFPVAYWLYRNLGEPFDFWMDENTCKPLVPLIQAQPGVESVELKPGIENYRCGGQPWHFGLPPGDHKDRQLVHLGLRAFPQRQLTLQAFQDAAIRVEVEPDDLAETPSLIVPEEPKVNRLVIHGMGICPHTKQTPGLWRFLASIYKELESEFDEIVFVGTPSDRETGLSAYPDWKEWADDGDFLKLGSYINSSRLMIACGSAPVVLAGLLKIPAIRVHDPIGDAPKVIWSNLGSNQCNATELELRTAWPEFRDRFVKTGVTA